MVKLSLFERVGFFDERFYPAYFEDNDFHYRMKLAGATEAIAPCGYDHVNSATIQKYTPKQKEAHHERFKRLRSYYVKKWGGMPGSEAYTIPFDGEDELF
jgi:GT2 family glycosyltransferase